MKVQTYYIYDQKTGEYIGKRQTTTPIPVWQPGVEAVREDRIPTDVRRKISVHPEYFKRGKGKFVNLEGKEKNKNKTSHYIEVH